LDEVPVIIPGIVPGGFPDLLSGFVLSVLSLLCIGTARNLVSWFSQKLLK